MNPLRALFLSLSKLPPALMLLIIIGLAVIVTMMTTGKIAEQEARYRSSEQSFKQVQVAANAPVIVARETISAGSTIEKSMVEQVRKSEKVIFEDSLTTVPNAVGRKVKNEISENSQIRESDLE